MIYYKLSKFNPTTGHRPLIFLIETTSIVDFVSIFDYFLIILVFKLFEIIILSALKGIWLIAQWG